VPPLLHKPAQDGDLKVGVTKSKTKEEAFAKLALFDERLTRRLYFGRNDFTDVEKFYGNCQAGWEGGAAEEIAFGATNFNIGQCLGRD